YIEISCLLNYSSQSHFIQIFKKYKHMTPKQYQQSHLKDH
ncbi:MAG: AraC family transcriptional regulator, partial [Coprobacillus cateniformis]|nr:AraC family transcriptional regulator [Coprobacillus cateniformis]